jgi:hypothetical protein
MISTHNPPSYWRHQLYVADQLLGAATYWQITRQFQMHACYGAVSVAACASCALCSG